MLMDSFSPVLIFDPTWLVNVRGRLYMCAGATQIAGNARDDIHVGTTLAEFRGLCALANTPDVGFPCLQSPAP